MTPSPDVIAELIEAANGVFYYGSGAGGRVIAALAAVEAAGYPARRNAELRAIEALAELTECVSRFGMYGVRFTLRNIDGPYKNARAALRDLGLGEG